MKDVKKIVSMPTHFFGAFFGYLVRAVVLSLFLICCTKKDKPLASLPALVYITPEGELNSNRAYNLKTAELLVLRDSVVGAPAFSAQLFRTVDKELLLTARIDTGLLSYYQRIAKPATAPPPLPKGGFRLVNETVRISAGNIRSSNSVSLVADDVSVLDMDKTYIVPVRLHSPEPGILPAADTLRQTLFFQLSFKKVTCSLSLLDTLLYTQVIHQSDVSFLQFPGSTEAGAVTINTVLGISVTIGIEARPSLVEVFNAANNTAYTSLPAANYNISKNNLAIAPGLTQSPDQYIIQIKDPFVPGNYLLPYTAGLTGPVLPGPGSTAYLAVMAEPQTVYLRNNWKVIAVSGADTAGGKTAANLFNNVPSQNWTVTATGGTAPLPQWFITDMAAAKQISGIMLLHNTGINATGQPAKATVYASMDGAVWDSGQEIEIPPPPPLFNRYLFINLPVKVQARYLKFEITETQAQPSDGVSIAKFGVY